MRPLPPGAGWGKLAAGRRPSVSRMPAICGRQVTSEAAKKASYSNPSPVCLVNPAELFCPLIREAHREKSRHLG